MKFLVIIILSISSISIVLSADKGVLVNVANKSALNRMNETIEIRWKDIRKRLGNPDPARTVVLDAKSGAQILSQATDESILFQSDFKPRETKSFIIEKGTPNNAESLVDGRYMEPRQDYAWENDRIAFRMYGPALAQEVNNGIDVWTKRVRHLIVAKWYKGDEDTGAAKVSYHIDHGEGADFFNVGRSLGCGSSAIWHNGKVYQPGVFSSYKTLTNGPIRISFELQYDKLDADGKVFKETKRISLDAGQNLNKIEVVYTGSVEGEGLEYAAGLVKRKNTTLTKDNANCWIGLWGPTTDDSTKGSLGTGIVIPKSDYMGTNEDKEQYLVTGKTKSGETVAYYAGAGWTRSGDFSNVEDWNRYLNNVALKLQSPLKISLRAK